MSNLLITKPQVSYNNIDFVTLQYNNSIIDVEYDIDSDNVDLLIDGEDPIFHYDESMYEVTEYITSAVRSRDFQGLLTGSVVELDLYQLAS